MEITIDFYKEKEKYCAFIGEVCGSGIKVKGNTPNELANALNDYLIDYAIDSERA